MMFFIIALIVIALYALLFVWVKANMNSYEKSEIFRFIGIGGIIALVISIILVLMNKIELQNVQIQNTMNLVNICLFAPLNALILLPYIGRVLNKVKQKKMTKEKGKQKIIIGIIVFMIILMIESGYVKSFQDIMIAIQNKG